MTYEMPLRGPDGGAVWVKVEDFDTNGILDCFAIEGKPDAVETIAKAYVDLGRHRNSRVGEAHCHLFEAREIVAFGVHFLEQHFGDRQDASSSSSNAGSESGGTP